MPAVSAAPILGTGGPGLRVLAVDDEAGALENLSRALRADPRVARVWAVTDATAALRLLRDTEVDGVFLDIGLPGLDGMELARLLTRFAVPPAIVFVTALADRALEAYDLGVVDYVRKPATGERLAESVRRVAACRLSQPAPVLLPAADGAGDVTVPVELGGTTRLVPRSAIRWVQAQGDYARLHTVSGSHLVRLPLAALADRWADAGFLRTHRSYLVQLAAVTELRLAGGGYVVIVDGHELPVSRRHAREVKDRLVRAAKQGWHR